MRFLCILLLSLSLALPARAAEEPDPPAPAEDAENAATEDPYASMKEGLEFFLSMGDLRAKNLRPVFLIEKAVFTPKDSSHLPHKHERSILTLLQEESESEFTILFAIAYPVTLQKRYDKTYSEGTLTVTRELQPLDFVDLSKPVDPKTHPDLANWCRNTFGFSAIAQLHPQKEYQGLVDSWLRSLQGRNVERRRETIRDEYKQSAITRRRLAMIPPPDEAFDPDAFFASLRDKTQALHKEYSDVLELEDLLAPPTDTVDALVAFDKDTNAEPALRPKLEALLKALDDKDSQLLTPLGMMHVTEQTHPDAWRVYRIQSSLEPGSPLFDFFKNGAESLRLVGYLQEDQRQIPWLSTGQDIIRWRLFADNPYGYNEQERLSPGSFFHYSLFVYGAPSGSFDALMRRFSIGQSLAYLLVPYHRTGEAFSDGVTLAALSNLAKEYEKEKDPHAFLKDHLQQGANFQMRTALAALGKDAPHVLADLSEWLQRRELSINQAFGLLKELHTTHPEEALTLAQRLQKDWDTILKAQLPEDEATAERLKKLKKRTGRSGIDYVLMRLGDPETVEEEIAYLREVAAPYPPDTPILKQKDFMRSMYRLVSASTNLPPESFAALLKAPLRPFMKIQLIYNRYVKTTTPMTDVEREALRTLLDDARAPFSYTMRYGTPREFAAMALVRDAHLYQADYRFSSEALMETPDRQAWCVAWAKAVAAGEEPPAPPFVALTPKQVFEASTIPVKEAKEFYLAADQRTQQSLRNTWLHAYRSTPVRRTLLGNLLKEIHPQEATLRESSLNALVEAAAENGIAPALVERIQKHRGKRVTAIHLLQWIKQADEAEPGFVLHVATRRDAEGIDVRIDPLLPEMAIPLNPEKKIGYPFVVILNLDDERGHASFPAKKATLETQDILTHNQKLRGLLDQLIVPTFGKPFSLTVYSRPRRGEETSELTPEDMKPEDEEAKE